jgi:hypothetical protein
MPSVTEVPARGASVDTHDLTRETLERPQPRRACPGFWHSLVRKLITPLPPAPSCRMRRPCDTLLDWLVREHPSLSVSVLALL